MPVRGMGNFLLCSILLGNVLVNNTLTVFLDTLTGGGGAVAVIGATLGIVVFGEIIPQAICSRHGLAVGAKTIWLTKFFMLLTAPISFPISKILDCLLGSEIGTVYNKERLMELLKVTDQYNDLEKDEVNIVTGALVLKQKMVKDVMTHLDDCYMLPIDTTLNFETFSELKDQGYSRIPVYSGERSNILHILFAKDLLFIDPDDEKPIEEVCKFYKNDVNFVYQDTILTDMFDEFKSGEKGHMAVVQKVNNEGSGDPYYETVGLVTIEDIIEEIIQQEIIDETDVVIDNKTKKKRKRERYKKDADFKMFLGTKTHHRVVISAHMSLAILQFLATSVRVFSPEVCSQRILQKLLSMDVYRELKINKGNKGNNNNSKDGQEEKIDENEGVIILKGRPCDFFVLIIEGRIEVTIGKEEHKFQEGPFSSFGDQMLEQALLFPTSPMMNSNVKGNNFSLSMHSSLSQETKPPPQLKKTATQIHLNTERGSTRSFSADAGPPLPHAKVPHWVPDYTLKAVTDVLYLKVRRNTYMVAVKASRMNMTSSDSGGLKMNDDEIQDVLAKITENDVDFSSQPPSILSPEKSGDWGLGQGTPTDSRRESMRSSFSVMKSKLPWNQMRGKSTTSMEKTHKDDFWDGMANPAMATGEEDLANPEIRTSSVHDQPTTASDLLSQTDVRVMEDIHEGVLPTGVSGGQVARNNTTVIEVQGSDTNNDDKTLDSSNSPSERTDR